MRGSLFTITSLGLLWLLYAWAAPPPPPATSGSLAAKFTDVKSAAGIRFTHNAGVTGKKWLPETMGPGCAFIDFDGDGWLDIVLVNGKDLIPKGHHTTAALYHNNHDGTFTDVTKGSGLDIE